MNFLIYVSIISLISISAVAQPKLQVREGSEFDWGTTGPGKLKASLHLRNDGSEDLKLGDIRVACGCTSAPLTTSMLKPGDTTTLNVAIDLNEKEGLQVKSIAIVSNDPIDSVHEVLFKANIQRDLTAEPLSFPSLLSVHPAHDYKSEVLLKNSGQEKIDIGSPVLYVQGMKATFDFPDGKSINAGGTVRMVATLTPTVTGYLSGSIIVPTSSRLVPEMRLSLLCITRAN